MEPMNKMLHEYFDDFIVVFLDDILIYSKSEEEHERHLSLVLKALWKNQFYVIIIVITYALNNEWSQCNL
jgi:hypothetical protein